MISVESLINALKNSDLELCHSAARALGIESLIDTLRHPDSEVRQSSAIVLGELGDKQAVEPLI
jgi:HEAT repeat protein